MHLIMVSLLCVMVVARLVGVGRQETNSLCSSPSYYVLHVCLAFSQEQECSMFPESWV